MKNLNLILNIYEGADITYLPEFDDAIIGQTDDLELVYSRNKMIKICMTELDMNENTAFSYIYDKSYKMETTNDSEPFEPILVNDIDLFDYK